MGCAFDGHPSKVLALYIMHSFWEDWHAQLPWTDWIIFHPCASVFWGDHLTSLSESPCSLTGFQALAVTLKGFNFTRAFSWSLLQGTAACLCCLCVLLGCATEIPFCPGWPPPHNEKCRRTWKRPTSGHSAHRQPQGTQAALPGARGYRHAAGRTWDRHTENSAQEGLSAWSGWERGHGQVGQGWRARQDLLVPPRPGTHGYQVGHDGPRREGGGGHCSYHFILHLSSAFWPVRKWLF